MDIALVITILFLCGLNAYQFKEAKKERERLVNAILAKSPKEFKELEEIVTPHTAQDTVRPSQPEMISMEDMGQEDWENAVLEPWQTKSKN